MMSFPHEVAHNALMRITQYAPMKEIEIHGKPYLQRYYMGEIVHDDQQCQLWLHRFLRNDNERHLHSHPWTAQSHVLIGWYLEQTAAGYTRFSEGQQNLITPEKIHRISAVQPDTWTQLIIFPGRKSHWKFIDDHGNEQLMTASAYDWHKSYPSRKAA